MADEEDQAILARLDEAGKLLRDAFGEKMGSDMVAFLTANLERIKRGEEITMDEIRQAMRPQLQPVDLLEAGVGLHVLPERAQALEKLDAVTKLNDDE